MGYMGTYPGVGACPGHYGSLMIKDLFLHAVPPSLLSPPINTIIASICTLSTLNISALHCVSLMAKANTMEYLSNPPPTWAGVFSGIEVKVCFSPLGGAVEVPLHFSNLSTW